MDSGSLKKVARMNQNRWPLSTRISGQFKPECPARLDQNMQVKVGVLLKTKKRRVNVYEIAQHFTVPPGIGARQRHNTPRNPNRAKNGRYVPLVCTGKVHAKGTIEVHAKGTLNQKSSLRGLFRDPLPSSPLGGNVRLSETSERTSLPLPNIQISEETIKKLLEVKTREQVLELLKTGNYPIPDFLQGANGTGT
jgi:hypothetical protein